MKFMAGLINHSLQPARYADNDIISSAAVSNILPVNNHAVVDSTNDVLISNTHLKSENDNNSLSKDYNPEMKAVIDKDLLDALSKQASDTNQNIKNSSSNHFDAIAGSSLPETDLQTQYITDIENERLSSFDVEGMEPESFTGDSYKNSSQNNTSIKKAFINNELLNINDNNDSDHSMNAEFELRVNSSGSEKNVGQQSTMIARLIKQANYEDSSLLKNNKSIYAKRRKSDSIVEKPETKQTVTEHEAEYLKAQKALYFQPPSEALSSELIAAYQTAHKKIGLPEPKEPPQVRIGQINVLIDDQASIKSQKKIEQSTSGNSNPFGIRGL